MTGKIAYVLLVLAAFLTALVLLSMGRRRVAVTRTRGLRGMFMVLVGEPFHAGRAGAGPGAAPCAGDHRGSPESGRYRLRRIPDTAHTP